MLWQVGKFERRGFTRVSVQKLESLEIAQKLKTGAFGFLNGIEVFSSLGLGLQEIAPSGLLLDE